MGFLTGPWSEFREYKEFVEGRWGMIPWPGSFVVRRLLMAAVAFVGFRLSCNMFIPVYITTDQFLEHSFFYRLGYYWVSCELAFSKYYVVWYLGEGATALFGLSYNGRDERGNPKWFGISDLMFPSLSVTLSFSLSLSHTHTHSLSLPFTFPLLFVMTYDALF
jgi:hypothetical protein